MKATTTLNTIPIKPLTAQELLTMSDDDIVYDDDNPKSDMSDWQGATMKVGDAVLGHTRGKQKAPTKIATTVRLDSQIIEYFKKDGKGWQTRLNSALREYIATH